MIQKFGRFALSSVTLSVVSVFGISSAKAEVHPHLCYIPGAGGGRVVMRRGFENEVRSRQVPFKVFDVGRGRHAQDLAQVFVHLLEVELDKDPDFRCHMLGYSMGGIVMRYAANHLSVHHPELGEVPVKEMFLTMTSASTPHRGTPAAEVIARYIGELDDGMMQMGETQIKPFNDPDDVDNYSPIVPGIPSYSYQSYLKSAYEAQGFPERLGYQTICQAYAHRPDHPDCTNDGIVPTASQAWGRVLGKFRVPHGFFGGDLGFDLDAVDVYEAHWHFLTGDLKEFLKRFDPTTSAKILRGGLSPFDIEPRRTIPGAL